MNEDLFKQRVAEALNHLTRAVTMLTYGEKREAVDAMDQARMVVGALRQTVQSVDEEEKTRA